MTRFPKVMAVVLCGSVSFPLLFALLDHMVVWSYSSKMVVAWLIAAVLTTLVYRLMYGHFPRRDD